MGYKNVCLKCKRVENLNPNQEFRTGACPVCSAQMHFVSHKFRPPKATDTKSWEVVAFLITSGFRFHTIRDENGMAVEYPRTMPDAKEFVAEYTFDESDQIVRRRHEIEQQIVDLECREQNQGRDILIKQLKKDLEALQ